MRAVEGNLPDLQSKRRGPKLKASHGTVGLQMPLANCRDFRLGGLRLTSTGCVRKVGKSHTGSVSWFLS